MRRVLLAVAALLTSLAALAEGRIRVETPNVVALDEQFNVRFIYEGEGRMTDFSWEPGSDFQLVWGPQKGTSSSTVVMNGKMTTTSTVSYTYILIPRTAGTFTLPSATAKVKGENISSDPVSIKVVSGGGSQSSGGSSSSSDQSGRQTADGGISKDDLFMNFTLSRTDVVVGEPVTATLKLYQRVNIAGFENAKFPSFNGFWSQQTEAPQNIEFKRESVGEQIYNTAVLRKYVLIPQQSGVLKIDPAELVVLVNIRTAPTGTSVFDRFFSDDYRTVRKRLSTPAINVNVKALPSGAPYDFGGGVGSFTISARTGKDSLKTHEASSLLLTISGKGNISLLQAPKVTFPSDFEVYDVKTTEHTDKATGGTSGSKTFEYPFIPRSHGDFEIGPYSYSYYDANAGRYVTLKTEGIDLHVQKGTDYQSQSSLAGIPVIERRDVRNLGEDIRFIVMKKPGLKKASAPFAGSALYWILVLAIISGVAAVYLILLKYARMRADIAGSKKRKASKNALRRLKMAGDLLEKNLYSAFYEELHKAVLGYCADKLGIGVDELSKEHISDSLLAKGADAEAVNGLVDIIDACEYARYSPDGGHEEMKSHYNNALTVISAIDSTMKSHSKKTSAAIIAVLLCLCPAMNMGAAENSSAWEDGVSAYSEGRWEDAVGQWSGIEETGAVSPVLFYNLGNAWYKAGNTPKAILYYERALKLDPSFKDAAFNLELVNAGIQDKIESVPEFVLTSWLKSVCRTASSDTWAVLSLLFLAVTAVLVIIFLLSSSKVLKQCGFYGAALAFVLCLFAFFAAKWERGIVLSKDYAVVMSPVAPVQSSPSANAAKDLFVLHEGTKVNIIDTVGEWTNISLSDGRQGWLKTSSIEII